MAPTPVVVWYVSVDVVPVPPMTSGTVMLVVNVGAVPNTFAPLPVSSVSAAARLADDGVARNVATFDPSPLTPVLIGSPVQLVSVPLDGVPKTGVVNVGLVKVLLVSVSVVALPTNVSVAAGSVSVPDAVALGWMVVVPDVLPDNASLPSADVATPSVTCPVPSNTNPADAPNEPAALYCTCVLEPAGTVVALAIQLVMPEPSVERTYPFVPPVSGSVSDQVPAAALGWMVTVPEVFPARDNVPLVAPATPKVGVALAEIVLAVAATRNVPAAAVVMPTPPLPSDSVPVMPVVKGRPVQFVSVPLAGVPRTGAVRVGFVNVGLVSVLLVKVSVVALPTKVSVAAGNVSVPDAATLGCNVVVPDVLPARTIDPKDDAATPSVIPLVPSNVNPTDAANDPALLYWT